MVWRRQEGGKEKGGAERRIIMIMHFALPLWQCDKKKARPLLQLTGLKRSTIIPGYSNIFPLNTLISSNSPPAGRTKPEVNFTPFLITVGK